MWPSISINDPRPWREGAEEMRALVAHLTTNNQSKKCFGLRTITNVAQSERKNGWL